MKYVVIGLAVALATILTVDIADAAPKKRAGLREITLTGKITKLEKKRGQKNIVTYVITDENGTKTSLPKTKNELIDLEEFVDAEVTCVGKGIETTRNGKRRVTLRKIIRIEKVKVAATPPPANDLAEKDIGVIDFDQ